MNRGEKAGHHKLGRSAVRPGGLKMFNALIIQISVEVAASICLFSITFPINVGNYNNLMRKKLSVFYKNLELLGNLP